MTLKVTKEILEAHNCCASGIVTFVNRLGERTEMGYQEFLELAFEMEKTLPEEKYVYFTLRMRGEPKFYLMQGAYTMVDKYQVFNYKTGQHEVFDSEVAARARRKELLDAFVKESLHSFSINREIVVNDGQDTMWVPITDLGMPE